MFFRLICIISVLLLKELMKPIKVHHFRNALWVYTLLIFVLAVLAINGTSSILNHSYILSIRFDYVVHFVIFIPWMWLVWSAYRVSFRINFINALFWVFIGLSIAGISEGLQYL